ALEAGCFRQSARLVPAIDADSRVNLAGKRRTLDLLRCVHGIDEAALRAAQFFVAAHQRWGHRASGNHEGLGLESADYQRQDQGDHDRLDRFTMALGGLGNFLEGGLAGAWGWLHGCGGPSHRRLFSRSVRTAGRAAGLAVLISHAPTNQVSASGVPEQNHLARCRDTQVSGPLSRVPPRPGRSAGTWIFRLGGSLTVPASRKTIQ